MKARDMRGQLFKEKLQRLQLEGEIRALQFSIKYKELTKKIEDAERSIEMAQTRINH